MGWSFCIFFAANENVVSTQ